MAEGQEEAQVSDIEETQEDDGSYVRKVTYTFDENVAASLHTYAFIHNLGTKDVLVSLRTPGGNVKPLKTYVQDENVVLVSFADNAGYQTFDEGDTIIAIG
jgi:hypothetical protein